VVGWNVVTIGAAAIGTGCIASGRSNAAETSCDSAGRHKPTAARRMTTLYLRIARSQFVRMTLVGGPVLATGTCTIANAGPTRYGPYVPLSPLK
jgi:hypothetical protein